MTGRYLTDLAAVVRALGLVVQEEPGWQSRARSSGGYASGRPTHVMVHHTASNPSSDGQADVNFCCYSSENKPVANLYLSRSGKVWIMAAGATNTNGKGGPIDNVPLDSMNTYAVGIEAANTGLGEPWGQAQQDAYVVLVAGLQDHYHLPHCRGHAEYAPSRKIDPAGQSAWAQGSATWNMDAFRASVAQGGGGGPLPPPTERRRKLYAILQDERGRQWATDMIHVRYLYNTALVTTFRNMLTIFGYGTQPTVVKQADIWAGCWGIITGGLPGDADYSKVTATYLDAWGTSVPAGAGQPAGVAGAVLQEIRAAVKG